MSQQPTRARAAVAIKASAASDDDRTGDADMQRGRRRVCRVHERVGVRLVRRRVRRLGVDVRVGRGVDSRRMCVVGGGGIGGGAGNDDVGGTARGVVNGDVLCGGVRWRRSERHCANDGVRRRDSMRYASSATRRRTQR